MPWSVRPTSSTRPPLTSPQTARVFQAMLEELVMDAALQSHQEVARSRTLCPVCKTRCVLHAHT